MKKVLKTIGLTIKWIAVLAGLPVLIGLLWIGILAMGKIGTDVSKLDIGHTFSLEKKAKKDTLPNVLLIMADDLGYGDLSCYGSTRIKTPHLDSLARQGMRFTQHYAGASVCSPSRVALMTGRYPIRAGFSSVMTPTDLPYFKRYMWHLSKIFNQLGVVDMGTDSKYNGIRQKEITLAEALKKAGYATGMSGKWHLGDLKTSPEFNPMYHGFDDFFGLNAANDEFPAALFDRDSMLIEDVGLEQDFLSEAFANRAINFIKENNQKAPFFYFLSFTAPHLPLVPSPKFKNTSKGGIYGDVVEEMDFYIGKVMQTLVDLGIDDNTIVIFTSDNGPWFKGSPGEYRGRKGQSFEGGFRVPFIAKWTGHIAPNTVSDVPIMNFDVYPTLLNIAGLALPKDRIIDGKDLLPVWNGTEQENVHDAIYFYHYDQVEAVRSKNWKYIATTNHYIWPILLDKKGLITNGLAEPWFGRQYPNLYDLDTDPSENYDLQHHYPDVVENLSKKIMNWEAEIEQNPNGWKN
jgi:uncharacterized sulfatase